MAKPKKDASERPRKPAKPKKGKPKAKTTESKDLPLEDLSGVAGGLDRSLLIGYPTSWKYCR